MKIYKKIMIAVLIATALNTVTVREAEACCRGMGGCWGEECLVVIAFEIFCCDPLLTLGLGFAASALFSKDGHKNLYEALALTFLGARFVQAYVQIGSSAQRALNNSELPNKIDATAQDIVYHLVPPKVSAVKRANVVDFVKTNMREGLMERLKLKIAYEVHTRTQKGETLTQQDIDNIANTETKNMVQTLRTLHDKAQAYTQAKGKPEEAQAQRDLEDTVRGYRTSENTFVNEFNAESRLLSLREAEIKTNLEQHEQEISDVLKEEKVEQVAKEQSIFAEVEHL